MTSVQGPTGFPEGGSDENHRLTSLQRSTALPEGGRGGDHSNHRSACSRPMVHWTTKGYIYYIQVGVYRSSIVKVDRVDFVWIRTFGKGKPCTVYFFIYILPEKSLFKILTALTPYFCPVHGWRAETQHKQHEAVYFIPRQRRLGARGTAALCSCYSPSHLS